MSTAAGTKGRPVSGTWFEAVQLLCPRPRVRPVSAPWGEMDSPWDDDAMAEAEAVAADGLEAPRLYASRAQYQVANSRVLGPLGSVDTGSLAEENVVGSPALSNPSSPGFVMARLSGHLSTTEGEKVHGMFCRTKSVVRKNLRRSKDLSGYALRSGYYSASAERPVSREDGEETERSGPSTYLNESPQVSPLRPVSKLLPKLIISIPVNDISSSIVAVHHSIEDGCDDRFEWGERDSLCVSPLDLHLSNDAFAPQDHLVLAETQMTNKADKDDNVFSLSDETYRPKRPMTKFVGKLRGTMDDGQEYKSSTTGSATAGSLLGNPSSTQRLRHTALYSARGSDMASLRSQFSASEPASNTPMLAVPKTLTFDEVETHKTVRVAPSLEDGLVANSFQLYEENAIATAAPVIHGVKPEVVEIPGLLMVETYARQDHNVLNQQRPLTDLNHELDSSSLHSHSPLRAMAATSSVSSKVAASVAASTTMTERVPMVSLKSGIKVALPTMPFEILETIVFSAAYGDAECQALAAHLYDELAEANTTGIEPRWGAREQHLLRQSHLVQDLDSLVRCGSLRGDIFKKVRDQLFPTSTTEMLGGYQFTAYVYRAVSEAHLDASRAEEIVELATGDEGFAQCSPEEEVRFERRSFNSEGFVYEDNTGFGHYERVGSVSSTVVELESVEPQLQPQAGWRSSMLWRVVHVFRLRLWKRKV